MEIIHNQTKVIKHLGWAVCKLRNTKISRLVDLVVKLNNVTKLRANFVVTREDETFLKALCVSMGWIIPEGGFKFQL